MLITAFLALLDITVHHQYCLHLMVCVMKVFIAPQARAAPKEYHVQLDITVQEDLVLLYHVNQEAINHQKDRAFVLSVQQVFTAI